ncbi:MAG: hypothetical protein FWG55_01705 [Candidatus Bathyarchaeota archaeon]|nr:hypothetical protein [Candidatus Termiticorpusculum sp.]
MPSIDQLMLKALRLFRKLPINPLNIGNTSGRFLEYFKGFDKVEAVKGIFGEKTTEILSNLKVEFSNINGYMYVDGAEGCIVISKNYLQNGNKTDIYLDLIHELCHVKQFMEGKELFDPKYEYVDRPTEIEAYSYTVQEARRIGLTEERICQYLKTEWMSNSDFRRLAKSVKVNTQKPHLKLSGKNNTTNPNSTT